MAVLRKDKKRIQDYVSLKPGSILRNPCGPQKFKIVAIRDYGEDRNKLYSFQNMDCPEYLYGLFEAELAEGSKDEILVDNSDLFKAVPHWEVIKAV